MFATCDQLAHESETCAREVEKEITVRRCLPYASAAIKVSCVPHAHFEEYIIIALILLSVFLVSVMLDVWKVDDFLWLYDALPPL